MLNAFFSTNRLNGEFSEIRDEKQRNNESGERCKKLLYEYLNNENTLDETTTRRAEGDILFVTNSTDNYITDGLSNCKGSGNAPCVLVFRSLEDSRSERGGRSTGIIIYNRMIKAYCSTDRIITVLIF